MIGMAEKQTVELKHAVVELDDSFPIHSEVSITNRHTNKKYSIWVYPDGTVEIVEWKRKIDDNKTVSHYPKTLYIMRESDTHRLHGEKHATIS